MDYINLLKTLCHKVFTPELTYNLSRLFVHITRLMWTSQPFIDKSKAHFEVCPIESRKSSQFHISNGRRRKNPRTQNRYGEQKTFNEYHIFNSLT